MKEALINRILVLDGAMGTMIQRYNLDEDDFRGTRFAQWNCRLTGCNDLLVLSRPDVIFDIHRQYLDAGADIIETNTFNANAISLADYGLTDYARDINAEAARLARNAVDEFCVAHPGEKRWVAGSVGPTSKSLSMSVDDDSMTWNSLVEAYEVQIKALIDGGVDVLLIETIFDTLNAKAAINAAQLVMSRVGRQVPIMLSVTLTEAGRTLSGQTLEAFVASVAHAHPVAIGLNCGFGIDQLTPYIAALQREPMALCVYPNAGLPNEMGQYDETPEMMACKMEQVLKRGCLNIVGGCCGTTPKHIAAIAQVARKYAPREIPQADGLMRLAGLEPMTITSNHLFVNVGERCNVAGSRKFLRLINEGNIDEAIDIARNQVENGAQIIDINMDDAMLDAQAEMAMFISRIGSEPDVARVPLMIDSSNWNAIVAALKCVQGRPIVNSISLKEGEDVFIEKAKYIKDAGAAVVVMAFDEKGQADTFERKIEVCGRAYKILTQQVGFAGQDIIFDPNVLAVATGIEAHNNYAIDFIKAVEWIKQNLPGAKVSGGISNLSFSFRGNNYVREAMHAVFLYHAIGKGMDMGIVNPSSLMNVDDVEDDLREALDDVLLNRCDDATERLVEIAERIKNERDGTPHSSNQQTSQLLTPSQKIEQMLVQGRADGIEQYLQREMRLTGSAVAIIDGPLMNGMNKVGLLFGQGKMFLPQVVKTAKVMKQAVAWLTPYIEQEKSKGKSSGRMVLATVKGDVHDIGKNIVAVIMNCNGYEVIDLGVMAPAEDIVNKAIETNADFVGLSGLITPSLDEMCRVAQLMQENSMTTPLLIGGATASPLHTAVKIAPIYNGPVVYVRDAAALPMLAQKLISPELKDEFVAQIKREQQSLREQYEKEKSQLTIEEARAKKHIYNSDEVKPVPFEGTKDMAFEVRQLRHLINWRAFFAVWKLDASMADIAKIDGCDHCRAMWLASKPEGVRLKASQAMQLWKDASRVLEALDIETIMARVVFVKAGSHNEEIVYIHEGNTYQLPTPRQRYRDGDGDRLSLSDFVKPIDGDSNLADWIGLFAVTTGLRLQNKIEAFKGEGDDYNAILYQSLADRLVEAATEMLHQKVKRGDVEIRPAIGYPSLPDQRLVFLADKVLNYAQMGITLTENGALYPPSSTTGYVISYPKARYFNVE